jgi:hypothetical protein
VSVADRGEPVASCSGWHGDGTAGEDNCGSGVAATVPARAMGEARPGQPELVGKLPEAARQPSSGKIIPPGEQPGRWPRRRVGRCGSAARSGREHQQPTQSRWPPRARGRQPEAAVVGGASTQARQRRTRPGAAGKWCRGDERHADRGGQPGGNGGLVRIGDALAPSDGLADASSGVGAKVMLEGESPFGVAALLNPSVHGRCCTPGWACRPRTAAEGGRPQGRP